MTATTVTGRTESGVPSFGLDLHAEDMLVDPYPTYARFREAGGIIWLERHGMFAATRYAEVSEILGNWRAFICGEGVGMNDFVAAVARTTLQTDPPVHDTYRRLEGRPLLPNAVRELEPELRDLANRTVAELKGRERFDGVADLAQVLPLGIVARRVGLPDEGREQMLAWAAAGFDSFGMLDNPRTQRGLETMREAAAYLATVPGRLVPGSWADQLMGAVDRGELDLDTVLVLVSDYLYPSLDTTIHAISAGLKLFADHPDQWDLLRGDRSLLAGAVSEVVRLGTPIQWFTRKVAREHRFGDAVLPDGSRVVVLYGSANRDERRFPDPDRFDITRPPNDQLGFGRGKHVCMGMPLARLEMQVLFDVMADSVARIETGHSERALNNVLHGFSRLEVTFR
ncbi:MAG: cytochrome P450 [Pseudonocardia sp.]